MTDSYIIMIFSTTKNCYADGQLNFLSDAANAVWIGPVVFEISTFKCVHLLLWKTVHDLSSTWLWYTACKSIKPRKLSDLGIQFTPCWLGHDSLGTGNSPPSILWRDSEVVNTDDYTFSLSSHKTIIGALALHSHDNPSLSSVICLLS
jgi:hypothetical protein